ncbi:MULTISPECIES: phage head closure protein [Comamonas]|uniref:phage head closure protein n=1 Tax=Comamonas TaxID=283 RepID=UPI00257CD613|nr:MULTISPECIES: phage head closure protein [Comamonas]
MSRASFQNLRNPPSQKLNKRVLIRLRKDLPVGASGVEVQYNEPRERWARIQPVGTATYTETAQTDTAITHRIWLRKIEGVTDAHEIVHITSGSVYRVQRLADLDGGNDFTIIEVEQLQ